MAALPTGYLGRLTQEQEQHLAQYKEQLSGPNGGVCPLSDHDCLRMLRARMDKEGRFDLGKSFELFEKIKVITLTISYGPYYYFHLCVSFLFYLPLGLAARIASQ